MEDQQYDDCWIDDFTPSENLIEIVKNKTNEFINVVDITCERKEKTGNYAKKELYHTRVPILFQLAIQHNNTEAINKVAYIIYNDYDIADSIELAFTVSNIDTIKCVLSCFFNETTNSDTLYGLSLSKLKQCATLNSFNSDNIILEYINTAFGDVPTENL